MSELEMLAATEKPEKKPRQRLTAAYLDKLEAALHAHAEVLAMQCRALASLTEEVGKLREQVGRIQPVVINSWGQLPPTRPEAAPVGLPPPNELTPAKLMPPSIGIRSPFLNGGLQ